jgi:exopolysaccharide/PEP-CTERM locus tyrosine autokinase
VLERGLLRTAGLLPPEQDMAQLARQYRRIKYPLMAQAMGRGVPRTPKGYLIMIASAMPGEGKTFTALNLSLSLALEKDIKVLLVDADVAKPQLSQVLGLGNAPGLLDVLRDGSVDVEALIRPTDVPKLSFLAAGLGAVDATELLSSTRMERLTTVLGQHDGARIVVFDSPPLLQTTESAALVRVTGQIVVVVRAETTPQPVVLDALKILEGHPAVSLVLNQSTRAVTSSYYYYGYGTERGSPADQTAA